MWPNSTKSKFSLSSTDGAVLCLSHTLSNSKQKKIASKGRAALSRNSNKDNYKRSKMRSRTTGGSAGSQVASHIGSKAPTRLSAAQSRNSGAGASPKEGGLRQRTFPPKTDYEKFYENVFLKDESDPEVRNGGFSANRSHSKHSFFRVMKRQTLSSQGHQESGRFTQC